MNSNIRIGLKEMKGQNILKKYLISVSLGRKHIERTVDVSKADLSEYLSEESWR